MRINFIDRNNIYYAHQILFILNKLQVACSSNSAAQTLWA